MCSRTPEIPIDDNDSDENGYRVHNKCEQEIFSNQRQHKRRWWKNLWHKQQEHNQWQQNTNAQRDLRKHSI